MTKSVSDIGYSVERLTRDNLADVAKLYGAVYGKPAAKDLFIKKYATAYTGKQYIGFVAYNKDRVPVGYYGVIPCFLQCGDNKILSAQSADTMTHPQYRFKGLFVELSNITFDLCRAEGIKIVFGFPNQNSFHGAINKLGWKMTESMDCFIIPVKTIPVNKIVRRISFLKPLYDQYQQWVLKKYATSGTNIANALISEGYCGVCRDADYFEYKTYHKTIVVKTAESLVWMKLGEALVIGDIKTLDAGFDETMHKIKKLAAKLGLNQVQFHISPGVNLHGLFSRRFKAVPSFPVLFQDMDSGIPLDKIKFSFADIDIF
ncbi:MAG: hypothetical protein JWQ30_1390 [Sediminibacterium sp.]|nr:hypothetical protein [Sediminibacterium sp.]